MSRWLPAVLLLSACVGEVSHDASIDFGDVAPTSENVREFVVRNTGSAPIEIVSSIDSEFFRVDEAMVTIPAGQSATLHVHFSALEPSTFEAVMRLHTTESYAEVPLRARAVGPLLGHVEALNFGEVPLFVDGKTETITRSLEVENVGNEAALLAVSVDDDDVCIGAWVERTCVPMAPVMLGPGATVEVPVELRATRAGQRQWRVTASLGSLRAVVDAFAKVIEYEPCQLAFAGPELSLTGSVPLTVTHVGSKRCRIDSVQTSVTFSPPLKLPHTLEANEPWPLTLQLAPDAEGLQLVSTIFRTYEDTNFLVNRFLGWSKAACLSFGATSLELGDVGIRCTTESRNVQVYNVCPMAVTIDSMSTAGAGFLWSGVSNVPVVVQPGVPFSFSVRAAPLSIGPQRGSVSFDVDGRTRRVDVSASATDRPQQRDNFHMPQQRTNDLAIAIDASPSFVSRRPRVRQQLTELFRELRYWNCIDWKVSMVPAEAGASWLSTDAGQTSFLAFSDGGAEAALEAFDRMPVGTENESCLDALSGVVPTVDDAQFLYCVTDADEHSPNVAQQIASLKQRRSHVYWDWVGPFGADTCGAEAPDAGVHRDVLAQAFGNARDICGDFWWPGYGSNGDDCERRDFYLSARVDFASPLRVFVNGQETPATDAQGNTVWRYDTSTNTVSFTTPPMSQSLAAEYLPVCF
ncbi:MAG: choice-of-anchor D domain-containing protein [Archangium sp.]